MSDVELGLAYSLKANKFARKNSEPTSPCYRVLPLVTDYLSDPSDLDFVSPNGFWTKFGKFILVLCTFPVSLLYLLARVYIIPDGCVGLSHNAGRREFLAPGWHFLASPLRSLVSIVNLNETTSTNFYPRGFCLVLDGSVMLARRNGQYILLGPGFHVWNDPMFDCVGYAKVAGENVVTLGPYCLITVPPGEIAITENNGMLVMLSLNETTGQRCHFLDHANWKCRGMLSTQRQIDSVTVTVTTADRVEVAVAATTAWGITDANRAALRGGHDMQRLREVVHRSAQGVLANMISVRKISDSAVGAVVMDDGTIANPAQLKHCNAELELIGAEISEIAIVQMHIVNEATRLEIAKIAAIPAKTKELRDVAEAQATSDVTIAKGRAQAMLEMATAEAESIKRLAKARQEAGELLGSAESTAATLACIEATGKALGEAKSSVFFVPPGDMRSLMANQNVLNKF